MLLHVKFKNNFINYVIYYNIMINDCNIRGLIPMEACILYYSIHFLIFVIRVFENRYQLLFCIITT